MVRRDIAPLSGGFMLTAIVGLLISILYFGKFGPSWGTTLLIFFAVMFIAALRSMTYGPSIEELKLDEKLAAYKGKIKEKKKKIRRKAKEAKRKKREKK